MDAVEERFRAIFRKLHAEHPNCLHDEWLSTPCTLASGAPADRPIVWSRRNGPWQQSDVLFIGAAPGNAGGKGAGILGHTAHAFHSAVTSPVRTWMSSSPRSASIVTEHS
jgi:hypothetical protein